MAVERQYRLLLEAGYSRSDAAALLDADPDLLEVSASSKAQPTSTPTTPNMSPYERYVSYLPYMDRRDLDDAGELYPWDRDVLAATIAQEPPPAYDPDLDDFYQRTVDEYLDELEAEYAEKLRQEQQPTRS